MESKSPLKTRDITQFSLVPRKMLRNKLCLGWLRAFLLISTVFLLVGCVLGLLSSRSAYASLKLRVSLDFDSIFDKLAASVTQTTSEDSKQLALLGWAATTERALTFPEYSSAASVISGDTNMATQAWVPRVHASARATIERDACAAVLNLTGCTLMQVGKC